MCIKKLSLSFNCLSSRVNSFLVKHTKTSRLKPPRQISAVTNLFLKKVSCLMHRPFLFSAKSHGTVNLSC